MKKISRRSALKASAITAGATTLGIPAYSMGKGNKPDTTKKLKILVVGAHPDDPETTSGGIISLFSKKGHEVVAAYLTKGEAGISGKSHEEAAKIRTTEAMEACKVMQARPEFLGQIDGSCEITKDSYTLLFDFLKEENPNIVITHWPIDTHRDHRICSNLVYDAWLALGKKSELYFCEAMSGVQTQCFHPDTYVDITPVIEQKRNACFCHKSQNIKELYSTSHEQMEAFRGMENNCKYAEAFVSHPQNPNHVGLNIL